MARTWASPQIISRVALLRQSVGDDTSPALVFVEPCRRQRLVGNAQAPRRSKGPRRADRNSQPGSRRRRSWRCILVRNQLPREGEPHWRRNIELTRGRAGPRLRPGPARNDEILRAGQMHGRLLPPVGQFADARHRRKPGPDFARSGRYSDHFLAPHIRRGFDLNLSRWQS
jgi:hypothetical protein